MGPLREVFPRLYGLSPAPGATVQEAWSNSWCPLLPDAISEQRLEDLTKMQSMLADLRPVGETRDAWIWRGSRFSSREAYTKLRAAEPPEDATIVRRCRLLWRLRVPLKIKVFGWLLVWEQLMTRAARQWIFPDAAADCVMCSGATEDCSHLFFECPTVQGVWTTTCPGGPDCTSADAFWQSMCQGPFRRATEWQTIFAILWAIWLHRNDIIFRGRSPSPDAIQHDAQGIAHSWHLGGNWPSGINLL